MHASRRISRGILFALVVFFLFGRVSFAQATDAISPGAKPLDVPAEWKLWIGDYGPGGGLTGTVAEKDKKLVLFGPLLGECRLEEKSASEWAAACPNETNVRIVKQSPEFPHLITKAWNFARRSYEVASDNTARPQPIRPLSDLRKDALEATPPIEKGLFRKPDLVELALVDPTIHLDIRYAGSNDFLGAPVYTQARAFLQRPAAEALVRVLHKLQPFGYGLLIHDGYRPWYVTKIFWDATPAEGKIFVADPAQGSRHNRGCAVDLTLYDLKTGQPVEMTGGYDEMSPRSFPDYPGGTSLQRWHRDLLRRAMESEGFTVYDTEWWHFDYKDWREHGILNVPFENLNLGSTQK